MGTKKEAAYSVKMTVSKSFSAVLTNFGPEGTLD